MRFLSDDAVAHLQEITELPDLSGTRYDLVRELGRGGMGVVYEVRDRELERNVAMKVVEKEWRAEARIIAALEHPGIVPIHDAGTLPDGRLYYTMKLVRGARLDVWASQNHGLTERLRLFARVCEPVAFAHANGVVHRDLKPENVMAGEFGAVLVMDWGIAGVGTPGYMAPEQTRGEGADARSDVHALGAMLAFLFRGDPIPRPLAAVIARAMAGDAAARYPDAQAIAEDVLRFLDHETVSAYRENVVERAGRWLTRHRALVTLMAAYIVMRVIVFFWIRL
ncbi:MAG: serine/threonine protein kinase [Acidobacteriota bacterium]|nr:serine/threonine protein kinase [Acidobacteriota bacterium]